MSITTFTIGVTSYPSYATVAEADRYLDADPALSGLWSTVSETEKLQRLIAATRRIDSLSWVGSKTDPAQTTDWPRSELFQENGSPVAADNIPCEIETATILMAASQVVFDVNAGSSNASLESERIGPKNVEYFYPRIGGVEAILGSRTVLDLVRCWLQSSVATTGAYVSGGQTPSEFVPRDRYGRTEGIG